MAKKDAKGNWITPSGDTVPVRFVPKHDKDRDRLVEKLFKAAADVNHRLLALKDLTSGNINAYIERRTQEYKLAPNREGNYILATFSGDKQLQMKIGKFIDFDDRLQFAKQKIDNCLERWSEGADAKLRTVVFDAFKIDRKGRVDTKRILGLRKLAIKDKEWQEAMDLIGKAVTVVSSKTYFMFRFKEADGEWRTMPLDLARI